MQSLAERSVDSDAGATQKNHESFQDGAGAHVTTSDCTNDGIPGDAKRITPR